MSDLRQAREQEIERNRIAFTQELANLPAERQGKFALIRHQQIIDYYDTPLDAMRAAKQYADQMYSIQQVINTAVNLGFFSYAAPLATA